MGRLSLIALMGTALLGLTSCGADGPPQSVSAIAGDGQATVSWSPPVGNPANIGAYEIQPWVGNNPLPTVRYNSMAATQTVTGLTNGTAYRFYVRAIDTARGKTAWSEPSNAVTPYPPGNVTIGPVGRPAVLDAPDSVSGLAPLIVLLHGYGSDAATHNAYLGVTAQAASRGTYVLLPNGTPGGLEPLTTKRFWNSGTWSPAIDVDDVSYIRDLIAQAIAVRPIDPDRVYVFGHSNGGAMAYRLACELSGEVTAIAALAGPLVTGFPCQPTHPVSVLSLHGTSDEVVFYLGGSTFGSYMGVSIPPPLSPYPGAVAQFAQWASWYGCDVAAGARAEAQIDLLAGTNGNETLPVVYDGCPQGIDVQLDLILNGTHVPALIQQSVGTYVLDWLLAHTG